MGSQLLEGSLDATAPADWCLKGKGNANLVFGYTGSDPNLVSTQCSRQEKRRQGASSGNVIQPPPARPPSQVGRVLRVRSGASSPASELERAVWGPVLGEREAEWEAGYVHSVLAPLLGAHHLPRQVGHASKTQTLGKMRSPAPNCPHFIAHCRSTCPSAQRCWQRSCRAGRAGRWPPVGQQPS